MIVVGENAEQIYGGLVTDLGSECITYEVGKNQPQKGRNRTSLSYSLCCMDDPIRTVVVDVISAHCGASTSQVV